MQVVPEPIGPPTPASSTSTHSAPPAQPPFWLEINVLGPFESTAHLGPHGSAPASSVPLHCSIQTSLLLACLALHAPRPISRDQLVTWLYPDHALDAGRQQLSQTLYRLRLEIDKAMSGPSSPNQTTASRTTRRPRKSDGDESGIILADLDTIGLGPDCAVVDALIFQREAKSDQLVDWQHAIQRYRGDLMLELETEWADASRARLRDQYEHLLEKACNALSSAGQLREAVSLARRWIAANELNEEAHRAFMRLSARLGHYAIAIKHFDVLAQLLRAELDTTPDAVTRRLVRDIRQESQADSNDNSAAQPVSAPFVGRRTERAALLQAAEGALKARGQLVLLEGESGIGKSRLLENVAHSATWRGVNVVWGHAEQHSAGQLYAPLNQALQHALPPARVRAVRAALPPAALDILSHFVPALSASHLPTLDEVSNSLSVEPGMRVVAPADAIQQLLTALSAQMPHLLILDDVQWADAGFWEVIRTLAPAYAIQTQPQSLSIILSYRDDELRTHPIAWDAIRELDQVLNPTLVRLAGLTLQECAELASSLGKPMNPAEASHLHEQTHGNPLFIEGLVEGRLPDATFHKQFATKLALLAAPTRRMLECAAVLGREFTHTTWQAIVDSDSGALLREGTADVMTAVPTLINARLIHETSHGYGFRHDMLREQIYAAINPNQRRELHRRAATVLRMQRAESNLLALHLEQAGLWHEAIRAYRSAGNQAESADAHASALQHYAHAFRLLAHLEPHQARFERVKLLCRRQLVYGMQLRLDEWRADIEELEALAQPPDERLSLITALEARMTLSLFASDPEGTRQAGEQALKLARSTRRRDVTARISNILGMHLAGLLRQVDRALPLLQDSVSYAQSVEDGPLLVSALCNLSMAQRLSGACHTARESATQARVLSESRVSVEAARAARASALHAVGCADWVLLNWNDARTSLHQAVQEQIDLNNLWRAAEALASLAHLNISMGQYADALSATEHLLALGRSIGVSLRSDVWNWVQAIWADVQTLTGNFEAAAHVLSGLDDWLQVAEDSRYSLIGLQAKGRWLLEQNQPHAALSVLKRAHRIWQHRKHAELEPVLLFVLAAHRAGEAQMAHDTLAEVTRYFQSGDSPLHAVFLHAVTHEVSQDPNSLYAAYDALQVQAGKLTAAMRETFIGGVRLNREVVQQYREARQTPSAQSQQSTASGRQAVWLARIGVPLGRPLTPDDMTEIWWTVDDGVGDAVVLRREHKAGLRSHRIQRLVREAAEQGAVPTYADLARALGISVRTLERDVLRLREQGHRLHTRRDTSQESPSKPSRQKMS